MLLLASFVYFLALSLQMAVDDMRALNVPLAVLFGVTTVVLIRWSVRLVMIQNEDSVVSATGAQPSPAR
jgi:hypothetical protein